MSIPHKYTNFLRGAAMYVYLEPHALIGGMFFSFYYHVFAVHNEYGNWYMHLHSKVIGYKENIQLTYY